jgi:uncharacterized protein
MTIASTPTQEDVRSKELDHWTILRTEVGSTAHGVTHSSNDIDEIAIYVPPVREMVGLHRPEHLVYRPGRAPHEPSGPGDLDRVYYSLRKFVGLLVNGNPSILFALFGPVHHVDANGLLLVGIRDRFVNTRTRDAYLGYAQAQRQRITGERGAAGRIRRSPEGAGAIDWKYAMHMVRLGIQGYEYLTTGHITTPSLERDYLLEIRSGNVPLDEVVARAEANEMALRALDLPRDDRTDWDDWLAAGHEAIWSARLAPWYHRERA